MGFQCDKAHYDDAKGACHWAKINPCVIPNSLEGLGMLLYRTLRNFVCHVYRNLPEPHPLSAPQPSEPYQLSGPEPSGTSSALCTGTLRNVLSHLNQNPPEPRLLSAPEASGTSSAICAGTVWNLISFLPPEPHQLSAPEPSKTSSGTFSGTWGCSCTRSHQSFLG